MTEDEAKTKVCCGPPFVGATIILTAPNNSAPQDAKVFGKCIASACMAWRTATNPGVEWHPFVSDASPGEGWYWSVEKRQWWRADLAPFGFCGLAGAAQ